MPAPRRAPLPVRSPVVVPQPVRAIAAMMDKDTVATFMRESPAFRENGLRRAATYSARVVALRFYMYLSGPDVRSLTHPIALAPLPRTLPGGVATPIGWRVEHHLEGAQRALPPGHVADFAPPNRRGDSAGPCFGPRSRLQYPAWALRLRFIYSGQRRVLVGHLQRRRRRGRRSAVEWATDTVATSGSCVY